MNKNKLLNRIAQKGAAPLKKPVPNPFDVADKLADVINNDEHAVLQQVRAGVNPAQLLASTALPEGTPPGIELSTEDTVAVSTVSHAPVQPAPAPTVAVSVAAPVQAPPAPAMATPAAPAPGAVAPAPVEVAPAPTVAAPVAVSVQAPAAAEVAPAPAPAASAPAHAVTAPIAATVQATPAPAMAAQATPAVAAPVAAPVQAPAPAEAGNSTAEQVPAKNPGGRPRKEYVSENYYLTDNLKGTGKLQVPLTAEIDRMTMSCYVSELSALEVVRKQFEAQGISLNGSEVARIALTVLANMVSTNPAEIDKVLEALPRLPRGRVTPVRTLVQ